MAQNDGASNTKNTPNDILADYVAPLKWNGSQWVEDVGGSAFFAVTNLTAGVEVYHASLAFLETP